MIIKSGNKCYNSWSCILSVLIILAITISIVYDVTVSKPQIRHDIKEIRENVQELNKKIDAQYQSQLHIQDIDSLCNDTVFMQINNQKSVADK